MSNGEYEKTQQANQTTLGKQKRRKRGWIIFGVVVLSLVVLVAAGMWAQRNMSGGGNHTAPYSSGKDNVAVIHINGTIQESNATYDQKWLNQTIDNAYYDKSNKGIALVINSPGGTVYESDETYLKLKKYKEDTGRPIYAYMESMAASGGYYIAAAADEITANRNTMTGSIGVIAMQHADITALLDRLGVQIEAVHSGANKLMGSSFEPLTEEQRDIFQRMSDEAYDQFVGIVAESRNMSVEEIKTLADGRIYTAAQAKDNGLVDEVLLSDEAFQTYMKEHAGLPEQVAFTEHRFQAPKSIWSSFISQEALEKLFLLSGQPDELTTMLKTIENLEIDKPMYLYEPALQ